MKKKPSLFFAFVFFLILSLSILSILGLLYADDILQDYEQSQPKTAVIAFLNELSIKKSELLLSLSNYEINEFNSYDDCLKWFDEKYENRFSEITFLQSIQMLGKDLLKYNLFIDEKRVGYIILQKTEQKSKYGFSLWEVIETNDIEYSYEYEVKIPENCEIYINGKSLDEKYFISEEELSEFPEFFSIPSPKTKTYAFGKFIIKPEITVVSENLSVKNTSSDEFKISYEYAEDRYEEIYNTAKDALTEYIMAISLDLDVGAYLEYLVEESNYYDTIKNYHGTWTMYQPEFKSTEIENFSCDFYKEYSKTQIIADISFNFTIVSQYHTQTYPAAYRLYFLLIDDEWKIAEMVNI